MPLPDFDTLKRVDTPDFDTLRPVTKTGTNPPASPSHDEEADSSVRPDPIPSNRHAVNIKLNPYEESFLKTGLRDPERAGEGAFTAELSQHLTSDVSNLARGITADIAAGFRALGTGSKEASEFSGNIVAALQREPLPIDKVLKDISGEAPATATIGKISQGIAATAPMLALGALPKALQTAALIGFTGKMISDAPEVARGLGDELGKPKDQQDPDRISSLVSEAIQITGFSIAGGFAMGTKMGAKLGTDPALAAKSEAIKPVAPLTAQAVKEIAATPIPSETPKGKGSTDALQSKSSQPVRDVQSQSGEVQGEVSTPKRSVPNDERGSEPPATQEPAKIVAAAYKPTEQGPPETGANHPEILNRLGIQDFPTRESRNTPQFGFVDEEGKFLTRPEAAERAKATGQQMEGFDVDEQGVEQAHSNEIASTTEPGKPIALAAPVEPPKPLSEATPPKEIGQHLVGEIQRTMDELGKLKLASIRYSEDLRGTPSSPESVGNLAQRRYLEGHLDALRSLYEAWQNHLAGEPLDITTWADETIRQITGEKGSTGKTPDPSGEVTETKPVKPSDKVQRSAPTAVPEQLEASPEPASPQSVAGKEGETAGAEATAGAGLSWEKTPSVRPGGKQYFWTAKTDQGVVRAVWNRATKKWSAQDVSHDSIGEFETPEQAKAAVERSLGGAEAQTAPERPPPKKPKKAATTPSDAASKVEQEVKSVAKTEGQRPAKEVKAELVARLEQALEESPATEEFHPITGKPLTDKASKAPPTIKIHIPGDGDFTLVNRRANIGAVLARSKRISVSDSGPTKTSSSKDVGDISEQADDATKAYGSPENAYKSAKRQHDSLLEQEPAATAEERSEITKKIDGAEHLMRELYGRTKAGLLEAKAEAARDRVATYKAGAEGFEKEIARLESIKHKTAAHKERLADLQERYKQNQEFIKTNESNADQWEQQSAKEKAALESKSEAGVEKAGVEKAPEPSLKGMGAALLGEVDRPNDNVISNMFAAIDRDRAAMGKPPMPDTQRRSWDEDNTRALNKMNRDPDWIPDLIKEVLKRPRPLLSWENAGLVWQRQKWTAELNNALQRISTAYEGGVDESLAEAKIDAARFEDNLEELDRAVGRSGTGSEAGRTLQAQKMGAGEDFTLIEMRLKKRAAVGGRPLTDTESAEIERLHKELDEAKKKHDTEIASRDQRLSEMANKLEVERLAREAKREPTVPPHIKIIADQVKAYFDKRADAAQKRLAGKLFTISPQVLADLTDLGISKILSGAIEFGEWSVKMAEALGEKVKPHLKTVWESSQSALNEHIVKIAGEGVKGDRVKRAVRGTDLQAEQERVTQNIKSRMDSGKKNEITSLVQHLARVFVEKGVKERDALIDTVHGVLKEIDPEFTRRETMDAISGYGDFRQLSKDTISKELRDLKGQMQQVAKLEDMQAGEPPLKTGVERRIPSKEESRLIKLVNDAKRQFQIPISDPDTQLRSPLDTLKKRMQTRIDELNQKIADKDYRPKQKREIVLDEAAMQSKVALDRIVKKYREGLLADRLANRTPWEKAMDWVTKYRRFGVLSSPIVIPKLISAGAQRLASVLPEDIAGEIWSRVPGVSKVAEKAPLEGGGVNLKAAMKGFGSAFSQGIKDAYDVIKTGHSDLDVLYGKAAESYTGESEMGSAILAFPGRLHGMIKAPVKRARFVDAAQRLGEYYANQGLNVSDPMVQMRIGLDAYKAAQRSIFLQDNRVASAFSAALRRLEQPDKATGKPGVGGKVLAVTGRTIFPIVRVPLNIVAETFQYAAGLGTGGTRLLAALAKGVETLTPEQSDLIMRELKKGSVGFAALAIGYFSADSIGGYYQPGHKKKAGDLKWGSIRVFDHDVPSYLLHNPLLETLQIGATLRHVADSKLRKKDSEAQGLTAGSIAAAIGVVEQVPFVREQLEIQKAMNPYTRHQWFGEQVKSIAVPAVVQKAAEWTDPEKKRNPTTIIEHVKSGVPGLREQVPTK